MTRVTVSRSKGIFLLLLAASILFSLSLIAAPTPHAAAAGPNAVRTNVGFTTNVLPANDDGSTGLVNMGFSTCFLGPTFNQLYVNNNGNITFDQPLSTYTPFGLNSTNRKIIAAFFADVDTRGGGSGLVTYGADTVNGRTAFGVNYVNVGYFSSRTDKLNSFQIVLIDRSDTGAGNFDIELNYDQIQWETGNASGGINGLGGSSARAGFSNGSGAAFELSGSGISGAFLDTNPVTGLIYRTQESSGQLGRFSFSVRSCSIGGITLVIPTPAPVLNCRAISAGSEGMFTADVPDNTVSGGDVFCRIIARDGNYITAPAEVGIQSIVDLGVYQAVDVFGMRASGTPVVPFAFPVRICLHGEGQLFFINAADANRTVQILNAFVQVGYTCGDLPNSGTLVLVLGAAPASATGSLPGSTIITGDCQATTLAMLNLRQAPDLSAAVIEVIPYNLTLQVTERTTDWVRVIYEDGQGWLNARYVRTAC